MAANKWTKWLVGLSGAALFTGFVGLHANESEGQQQSTAAASAPTASVDSGDSGSGWQPTDQGGFGRRRSFIGGDTQQDGSALPDTGSSGSTFGGGSSRSQSDSSGFGSMRTHGS